MTKATPSHKLKTQRAWADTENQLNDLRARLRQEESSPPHVSNKTSHRRRFESCMEAKPDRAVQRGRTGINPATDRPLIDISSAPSAQEQHMAALAHKHRYGKG